MVPSAVNGKIRQGACHVIRDTAYNILHLFGFSILQGGKAHPKWLKHKGNVNCKAR